VQREAAEAADLRAVLKLAITRATAPLLARLDQLEATNRDKVIGLRARLDQLQAAERDEWPRLVKGATGDVCDQN
jgi:hypothetical protein